MKSMGKTSRGGGFRGTLDYCFDHDGGRVIGGNMCGDSARDLSREFGAVRRMRPEIKKPVWHQALRLPAGEVISDEKWAQIGEEYMKKMGFDEDHPYTLIKHELAEGHHIHVVASRISLSGKLFYGVDENLLSTKVTSELEKSFNLALTTSPELDERTGLPSIKTDKSKPKRGSVEKALATGVQPPIMVIQNTIDAAIPTSKSLAELAETLEKRGVQMVEYIKDGEVKGLSFLCDGSKFSGSQLGDAYKLNSILGRMKDEQNERLKAVAHAAGIEIPSQIPDRIHNGDQQINTAGNRPAKVGAGIDRAGRDIKNGGAGIEENQGEQAVLNTPQQQESEMYIPFFSKSKSQLAADKVEADRQERLAAASKVEQPPVPEECGFGSGMPATSTQFIPSSPYPPTLGGRLTPVEITGKPGVYNLSWPSRDKPTFRCDLNKNTVNLLATPSRENVKALMDLAAERGLDKPMLQIFGSVEFIQTAAIEAAARGVMVDFSGKDGELVKKYYDLERDRIAAEQTKDTNGISRAYQQPEVRKPAPAQADKPADNDEDEDKKDRKTHLRG